MNFQESLPNGGLIIKFTCMQMIIFKINNSFTGQSKKKDLL